MFVTKVKEYIEARIYGTKSIDGTDKIKRGHVDVAFICRCRWWKISRPGSDIATRCDW